MERVKKIVVFLFLSFSIFAENSSDNRVNSTTEKIKEIEKQIQELELKKKNLETLKNTFVKNKNVARPKVGLVLSGGGAKGAAHIGVLKTLEKYQIPVDYIVGTSAGSIIAAMYSVGYTPDEIEKVVTDLKFYDLFKNSSSRDLEGIVQKTQSNKYPLNISLTKDFNLSLPMGVLNGEHIYLELKKIFARAEGVKDFKDFPIPFRAMTTNLQTGESVEINSGDLALSTLKSMAIPTFLDPIRDGDNYYVDGGVVDNFPVLQAINMGADIVIGVDIAAEPLVITDNSNIIQILDKLSTYTGDRNTEVQTHYPDILITPDVKKHSTLDFDNLKKLVEEGEVASEQVNYALSELTDKERYAEINRKKESMRNKKFDIKNVEINGNELLTVKEVEKLKPKGEELNIKELNLWAEKIFAKNYVDRVFYTVDGDTINFTVREKLETKLKAGVFYISNYGAGLEAVADVPVFNKFNLSQKNYTLKAEFSKYPKISLTDITQYTVWDHKLLVSAGLSYGLNPIFLYKGGDNISTYENNTIETTVSIGTTIFNEIIAGYTLSYKNMDTEYSSGEKLEDLSYFKKDGSYFTNTFSFYYDTMNQSEYATKGSQALFQAFTQTNAKKGGSYNGYSAFGTKYIELNKNWSLNGGVIGGQMQSAENAPLSELFTLGGLRSDPMRRNYSFTGLPISSVYTDNFFIAKAGIQYTITPSLYLTLNYNMGTYNYNSGFSSQKGIWDMEKHGYGAGIGWDTFLGPMDFMISNDVLNDGMLFQVHIGYVF
ncbi:patatin-like phospholipase family protein [Candidatus Cetobacterium colombiensis]|uniref:Patatin-like phospholipase family protein n=1 Tax=Candidatus Cetobacterium colombiensis TaxID=3073100 RepID=A0ABU4W8M1_9FUSO|nr:patatin-like phospholipase family protein [Candidatus Cetobacterium colombiensis]MDX8335880.1 patatin-like phospholipase family protein [Candidatus Cetobacterium colombiensis]